MRELRTEDEIIANWKGDIDQPFVSICCITYNHEPYIEDALEGFLIQETDFPFEILIHDDASTDRTADIVREYEAKYPRLIKPIYQTENQYSKTVYQSINGKFNIPRAKGEYLAFCEGDDYWISSVKLERQHRAAIKSGADFVFHKAIYEKGGEKWVNDVYKSEERFISFKEHLKKGPSAAPHSTIMLKRKVFDQVEHKLPGFVATNLAHSSMQYCGFLNGEAYFIPDTMSVYRVQLPGSWSSMTNQDFNIKVEHINKRILTLRKLKECVLGKYKHQINKSIVKIMFLSVLWNKKMPFLSRWKLTLMFFR